MDLHFAELPRERDLRARRNVLRRKQQHLIAQEGLVDGAEDVVRDAIRQVRRPRISAPSFGVSGRTANGRRRSAVEFMASSSFASGHFGQM